VEVIKLFSLDTSRKGQSVKKFARTETLRSEVMSAKPRLSLKKEDGSVP